MDYNSNNNFLGSQHLHELGSMKVSEDNGDFDQTKRNIMKLFNDDLRLNFLPEFYRKRGLFVSYFYSVFDWTKLSIL